MPFAVADATTLTSAGYVGDDAETIIKKLLDSAEGDVKRAETGIVFIDEIDKIASRGGRATEGAKDVGGEGVQQALLKILEGTKVEIKKRGMQGPGQENATIVDTSNVLFVGSGAFSGLERIVSQRIEKKSIGFGTDAIKSSAETKENIQIGFNSQKTDKLKDIMEKSKNRDIQLNKVNSEDLQKFGLIPEFIGRLPIRVSLKGLTEEDLINILVKPKNAIIPQFQSLLRMDGATLDFTPGALSEIAKQALIQETGARGLRSIIEKMLLQTMFDVPDSDIINVNVDEACVKNGENPSYTRSPKVEELAENQTNDNTEEAQNS